MDEAVDVNEEAWDASRDVVSERVSLLRELDLGDFAHPSQILDPSVRTVGGLPLGQRRRELLLACTFHDLEILVNEINVVAGYNDDEEHSELAEATAELEKVIGQHRVLRSDSDERTLDRMPVTERRRARLLQLRIDELRLHRYQPTVVRRRELTAAAAPELARRLGIAVQAGDELEAARCRHLLESAQRELEQLSQ